MNLVGAVVLAMATGIVFSQCDGKKPKVNTPDEEKASASTTGNGVKMAFVDMDSISNNYKLYLNLKKELEQKQKNSEAAIYREGKKLNALGQRLQAIMQGQQQSTQQEVANLQRSYAQQQQKVQQLQEKLGTDFQNQQNKYMDRVHDSIASFLKAYNADKKYTVIMEKGATLLSDPANDITKDVINGLNKRYNDSKK